MLVVTASFQILTERGAEALARREAIPVALAALVALVQTGNLWVLFTLVAVVVRGTLLPAPVAAV
jgi:uncharacterized membrane protein YesL